MSKVKYNIVLGSVVRSRNGCLSCKKSKKKCDEAYPSCQLCLKRGITCEYNNFKPQKNIHKKTKKSKNPSKSGLVETELFKPDFADTIDAKLNAIEPINKLLEVALVELLIEPTVALGLELIDPQITEIGTAPSLGSVFDTTALPSKIVELDDDFLEPQSPESSVIPRIMTSDFNIYLDSKGLQYLQYFEEKVSYQLCIDRNSSNYFVKTFLQMSLTEESISNALACWGGVFRCQQGLEDELVKSHLRKAIVLARDLKVHDNTDYYSLMCFFQIMLGIQICLGDVKVWSQILSNCFSIIKNNGGIKSLYKRLGNTNDVKWLISNFQYHDTLQSGAFFRGTEFDPIDYRLCFDYSDDDNYGVDPYQGCNHNLICLLGEILNIKKIIPADDYKTLNTYYNDLSVQVDACPPVQYQLDLLSDDAKVNYLRLFDVYKACLKLILLMYFKRINSASVEIQLVVEDALEGIRRLVDSNLISCLALPLLIIGINVIGDSRVKYTRYYDQVNSLYKVKNLNRVKSVIDELWLRNENGDKYVDWIDIVKEFKWEICLC